MVLGVAKNDRKIVCHLSTNNEIEEYDIPFNLDRVDLKLCTHVVSADNYVNEGMLLCTFGDAKPSFQRN